MPAVFEWIYKSDTSGVWNPMPVSNPTESFYVRGTDTIGGETKVIIKEVIVCDESYSPQIFITSTTTPDGVSYELFVDGIPSGEVVGITWTVKETVDGVESTIAYAGPRTDIFGLTKVCASAVVDIACGCPDVEISETCFTFDFSACDGNLIGLDIVDEDGTYKAVRTGTLNCCVALDVILWKINLNDPWEVLRLNETIYANEIWFKRVVIFDGNICDPMIYEVKAK